jgi:hypothetical protein
MAPLREQLDFEAVGAREAPGRDRDAPREHRLERALGCQLRDHRRLEFGKFGGILVRQHDVLFRPQAVLERVLRRARLALRRLRPARPGAVAPARLGARIGHGNGRARRGANIGHDGGSLGWRRGWLMRAQGSAQPRANPLS